MSEIPCDCCGSEGDHPGRIICDACFQSAQGKAKCCIDTQAENRQLRILLKELRQNIYYVYWRNHSALSQHNPKIENLLKEIEQVLKEQK